MGGAVATDFQAIVVGTGFAASFFLHRYLALAPPDARVLVLERGRVNDHRWQVANGRSSDLSSAESFRHSGMAGKSWRFTLGFGGGSNCWWGNAFRLHPNDFRLRSLYGVGRDWPLSYDDLEPYYQAAEEIMAVSGPPGMARVLPRTQPFPQPPHRLSRAETALQQAWPGLFFPVATARARLATSGRSACCANGVCEICLADAKFTILNGLMSPYRDPRITLLLRAEALAVDIGAGRAGGVVYRHEGREMRARSDLVVLGANAIFNAFILQRSGFRDAMLGRCLHEQLAVTAEAFLDGLDHFDGSTSVSGLGYMLYDGNHRRHLAACLIETVNVGQLRAEPGRWRQVLPLRLIIEDLPRPENRVEAADGERPTAVFEGYSPYALRRLKSLRQDLERVLAPLPVERLEIAAEPLATEAHIQGTTVMGDDPADSVVDRDLVHHRVRNLLVLGSGAFPACSPAHPTLTICALSLRAADRVQGADPVAVHARRGGS